MIDKIDRLLKEIGLFDDTDPGAIEKFRIQLLGQKGAIKQLFEEFKTISSEQKKELGLRLNTLKTAAEKKVTELKRAAHTKDSEETATMDTSLPGEPVQLGSRHPVSIVRNEIIDIFSQLGFTVEEGPEIEDDWHNFSALNFPQEHPARDMQDTFFIEQNPDIALRTHTSSVQIRAMENNAPPIRIVCPGRVFRNEAISARSHCIFHQVEGLYIDENVSFADMKQTLLYFAKEFFGEESEIRLRPSYFPFTEPSAEMDVSCSMCNRQGCNVCKHTGWLEVMGCGMVDPAVLDNCGIDSQKYTGYAFGIGIERPAMLKYRINDIRMFFENDIRFLSQFKAGI